MAYGLHDLELTGLQIKTILSVHILHKPGEHGKMELTADLGEENGDFPIQEAKSCQKITLFEKRDEKRNPLFCGVITGLEVQSEGKSFHVKVTAYTYSYLMDIKKKSRSFQDRSMTMGALVSGIVKEYGGQCQLLFNDSAIGEIAVQYDETDWHFIKRMLSTRHIPLACSEITDSVCLYLGTARIPAKQEILSVEKVWKDMDELSYWKETGEDIQDESFIIYQLKLDNHIMLYADIDFRGRSLTAAEVEYATIGSTVYEFVTLRKKTGILQKTIYPMELVGSALEGTILNVKGEKVQIHLKIDDGNQGNDCYWFPFSTPSASSDGSGWYCMPEKGDLVRVYFPSKKTSEAIAISAVSTYNPPISAAKNSTQRSVANEGGSGSPGSSVFVGENYSGATGGGFSTSMTGGAAVENAAAMTQAVAGGTKDTGKDKMSDPATKYLRVPSGQEVKLSPKGIEVICSSGSAKIEILKSGRINISAENSIRIKAKCNVILNAKYTTKIQCKERAYLKSQRGGSVELDKKGNLNIQGTEVHVN